MSNLTETKNMNNTSPPNVLFYSMKCQTCKFFMTQAQNVGFLKFFKLICVDGQEKTFQTKGLKMIPTIIVQNNSNPIEGKGCLLWLENMLKNQKLKNIDNPNDQYLPETGINQQNNKEKSGNSNQFPVSNTNVLRRGAQNIQTPPIEINPIQITPIQITPTIIKGKQVPNISSNKSINKGETQLNSIQQSNTNLVQLNNTNSGPNVKPRSQLFGFLENEMSGCSDNYAYLLVDNALPKSFLPPDKDLQIYTAPEGNKLDKKTQEMYLKNMEMFRDNDKDEYKKTIEKQHNDVLQNNLRK